MADPIDVAKEDLDKIIEIQRKYNELARRFGELHFQSKAIQEETRIIEQDVESLDQDRMAVFVQLQEKYGAGHIDMNTGKFIPDA